MMMFQRRDDLSIFGGREPVSEPRRPLIQSSHAFCGLLRRIRTPKKEEKGVKIFKFVFYKRLWTNGFKLNLVGVINLVGMNPHSPHPYPRS